MDLPTDLSSELELVDAIEARFAAQDARFDNFDARFANFDAKFAANDTKLDKLDKLEAMLQQLLSQSSTSPISIIQPTSPTPIVAQVETPASSRLSTGNFAGYSPLSYNTDNNHMNDNDYNNDYNFNYTDIYDCYDTYDKCDNCKYEDRNSIDGLHPGLITNFNSSVIARFNPEEYIDPDIYTFRQLYGFVPDSSVFDPGILLFIYFCFTIQTYISCVNNHLFTHTYLISFL